MGDTAEKNTSPRFLSRVRVNAVLQLVSGAVLAVLSALPPPVSAAVGVVLTAIGLMEIASRDTADKKIGLVLTASGVAAVLSKYGVFGPLKAVSGLALAAGAAALIGLGIFNAARFIIGLKKLS
ncbi:MAG: hypothetical protein LBJ86_07540 [Spirochaetaceae bacterium]|jgi:hypothetical protein|nr:hypothetical protein [Spirochaetaceae bacterium]